MQDPPALRLQGVADVARPLLGGQVLAQPVPGPAARRAVFQLPQQGLAGAVGSQVRVRREGEAGQVGGRGYGGGPIETVPLR